jgi:hypothetical protein
MQCASNARCAVLDFCGEIDFNSADISPEAAPPKSDLQGQQKTSKDSKMGEQKACTQITPPAPPLFAVPGGSKDGKI